MNKLTLFFTLTLLFHFRISLSSDPKFGSCPPKLCGHVNVTYPFRVIGQQNEYCGFPGFEVSCQNGTIPLVNISGNSYVMQNIWYKNQSFQVANSVFFNSTGSECLGSIRNLTLEDAIFDFPPNYSQINLFWKCTNKILQEYKDDLLKCEVLALYEDDPKAKGLEGVCHDAVSVPVEGQRGSNLTEVLRRGVVLNWTANNCSACVDSGGQCGFDNETSEFKCFCSDRAHAYHCVPIPLGQHSPTLPFTFHLSLHPFGPQYQLGERRFDFASLVNGFLLFRNCTRSTIESLEQYRKILCTDKHEMTRFLVTFKEETECVIAWFHCHMKVRSCAEGTGVEIDC